MCLLWWLSKLLHYHMTANKLVLSTHKAVVKSNGTIPVVILWCGWLIKWDNPSVIVWCGCLEEHVYSEVFLSEWNREIGVLGTLHQRLSHNWHKHRQTDLYPQTNSLSNLATDTLWHTHHHGHRHTHTHVHTHILYTHTRINRQTPTNTD